MGPLSPTVDQELKESLSKWESKNERAAQHRSGAVALPYSRSDEEADSRFRRSRMRFPLRVEQVSVVAELVPEPAEAIGVSGGDAAAEVEDPAELQDIRDFSARVLATQSVRGHQAILDG